MKERNQTFRIVKLGGLVVAAVIGLMGNATAQLTINGSNQSVSSNTNGIIFQTDNAATINYGVNITGPVTTTANNQGSISGNGVNQYQSSIGASGFSIKQFIAAAGNSSVTGDLYSSLTINYGTLSIGGVAVSNVRFEDNSGILNLNGGLIGNVDMYNMAGTVNLADAQNLTGNVSSGGGRNGTFNVLGTSTISGTVVGFGLNTINAGADGKVATFSSSVDTTTLNLSGTGTINLNGGLTGNLNFNNKAGTVNLANLRNLTGNVSSTGGMATGSTLNFLGASTFTGSLSGVDIVNTGVGGAAVNISGALTMGNNSHLNLGAGITSVGDFQSPGNTTLTVTAVGNGTTFTSNGRMAATSGNMSGTEQLIVNMTNTVANGTKFKLIDFNGGNSAVTLMDSHVSTNSATLTFKAQSGNDVGTVLNPTFGTQDEDLWVVASYTNAAGATYVASGNVSPSNPAISAGNALSTIANGSPTGDMQTVINTFNTYSAAQLNREVPKLAPVSNNALTSASLATVNAGLGTISARLANLRGEQLTSAGQSGLSAGDDERSRSVWLKGFGSWGQQDAKDAYNGYKANSAGVSLGADTLVGTSDLRLGAAFSYAGTGVDQQDERTGDSTNIKSYQGTVYAMKEFGPAYLDGLLAYARHDYKSHRATALSRTASADWNGRQLSARVDTGYRIPLGATTLIPLASLEWSRLKQDAYTESGADSLNLNVDEASTTRLRSGLGARLQADTFVGGMAVKPEARLVWFHDFKDAGTDTTSSYTGGGASFSTPGQKIEKDAINVGLGMTVQPNKLARVSLNYDFEGRSGYQSHAVQLTGRWDF